MAKSIFFSWQSDTPSSNGRGFLRKALEKACDELASDTGISEAIRDEGLEVDSDTQGVAGQPPLVDTILKKIDASSVFVADMTFTCARMSGGLTPNPNVLIEYGWALKSLSHSRVISVMNEVYGKATRESLPFDLAHTRWPIRYSLDEQAPEAEKEEVRKKLVSELKQAIKVSLATIPVDPVPPQPDFGRKTPMNGPARFRARSESLGFDDGFASESPREVFLTEGSEIWLRLIPNTFLGKQWPISELKEKLRQRVDNLMPPIHGSGCSFLIAEDGVGVYVAPSERNGAQVITQGTGFAFTSGEVWGIDTALLSYAPKNLYQHDTEKAYISSLQNYSQFLSSLGIQGPYRWIAGIRGVKGRILGYPPPPGKVWVHERGPICMTDIIEAEGEYNPEIQTPTEALLPFFEKIFDKCGRQRPAYLN